MPKSAVAILSWNRIGALKETVKGLLEHCPQYPIAIFEDGGYADNTSTLLTNQRVPHEEDTEIEAIQWSSENQKVEVYMGTANLGVAGNTNRAIAWMWRNGYDHLCICNDDLIVKGDFVKFYADAHIATEIGIWCFCDFTGDSYKWHVVPYRGYKIKLLSRMTGIMISLTRSVIQTIGFMDPRIGKFGEDHVEYSNRAKIAGFTCIDGMPQHCLDVEHDLLAHQECESSISKETKPELDRIASQNLQYLSQRYIADGLFRPFTTRSIIYVGGRDKVGMRIDQMHNHALVIDRTIVPEQ